MGKALVPFGVAVIRINRKRTFGPEFAQRRLSSVDVEAAHAVQGERLVNIDGARRRVLVGLFQGQFVVIPRLVIVVVLLVGRSDVQVGASANSAAIGRAFNECDTKPTLFPLHVDGPKVEL